jgi:ABC-type arginine/histidine transport system permease subunit
MAPSESVVLVPEAILWALEFVSNEGAVPAAAFASIVKVEDMISKDKAVRSSIVRGFVCYFFLSPLLAKCLSDLRHVPGIK